MMFMFLIHLHVPALALTLGLQSHFQIERLCNKQDNKSELMKIK